MKRFGDIDGFLAQCAVDDEENFVGLHARVEAFYFLDQFVIDLEPTGSVEDNAVGRGGLRCGQRRKADGGDVQGGTIRVKAELFLLGEDFELVDGGGAIDVAADDQGAVAAFFEEFSELGRRGRLARTVEADHEDLERTGTGEGRRAFAEEFDQFVVDDFDDLLARGDALEDLLADALRLDAFDEFSRDFEMHVGGQQGGAHFLERLRHIFFREFADAAEIAEGTAEFFRERFKHRTPPLKEFPARSNRPAWGRGWLGLSSRLNQTVTTPETLVLGIFSASILAWISRSFV